MTHLLTSVNNSFEWKNRDEVILLSRCYDIGMVVTTISNVLTHYLKLNQLGYHDKDVNICLMIDQPEKFKQEDKETNLDRINFVCNEFESNNLNVNYNIYHMKSKLKYLPHESTNSLWYFKKQWIGDYDQIMIKKPSSVGYSEFKFKNRDLDLNFAYEYAEENKLKVIEFDYTNKFDWILEEMIHSKLIVSDRSGLTVLGTFSKCPVILVTEEQITMHIGNKERVVTWGNGNLSLSSIIDHVNNGQIEQKWFDGYLRNITPEDKI